MKIQTTLSAFIVLLLFLFICFIVGFVAGFSVSAVKYYEKGQLDMLNEFLGDELDSKWQHHKGIDIWRLYDS